MEEKASAKKEEVRQIVLDAASMDLARKLDLVDVLQRLGVDYHFKEETDELLKSVFDDKDGGSDDLYLTSLRFYLHRKHGYAVSSGKKLLCLSLCRLLLSMKNMSLLAILRCSGYIYIEREVYNMFNYKCRCV